MLSVATSGHPGLGRRRFRAVEGTSPLSRTSFQESGALLVSASGSHHRALAVEAADGLVWFWIGTHADYDELLG